MKPTLKSIDPDCIAFGENPRVVNEEAADFVELVESVQMMGILEPIHVRTASALVEQMGNDSKKPLAKYILLAGERRLRATRRAGLKFLPAYDHGVIDDDEAFMITVHENRHAALTPMEEARQAAMAVKKCDGDLKAAATILGVTKRWVKLRARIESHLAKPWSEQLVSNPELSHLTVGHLAVLARWPEAVQTKLANPVPWWLKQRSLTISEMDAKMAEDQRQLAKAPFDTAGCANCSKRTGHSPMLWADDDGDAVEKNDRCLDAGCFYAKAIAARRATYDEAKAQHKGLLVVDNRKDPASDGALTRELNEAYGESKVERTHAYYQNSPGVTLCKKGDKGAKPALVVAGGRKGQIAYVKVKKAKSSTKPKSKLTAEQKAEKVATKRWETVYERMCDLITQTDVKSLDNPAVVVGVFLVLCEDIVYMRPEDYDEILKALQASVGDGAGHKGVLQEYVTGKFWAMLQDYVRGKNYFGNRPEPQARTLAALLGLDAEAMYQEVVTAEAGDKENSDQPEGR